MTKVKEAWIAGSMLALVLAAGGLAPRASATSSAPDSHEAKAQGLTMPLDSMEGLEVQSVRPGGPNPLKTKADIAAFHGRRALHVVNQDLPGSGAMPRGGQAIAIVKVSDFKDGTIEADVAGGPRRGAPPSTRGFVGIAFRVQDHGSRYECFYLRITNGRADDQLRRNHSTQYISEPEFPWNRLREENPGVYESYVDIDPDVWTRMKIVVTGTKASLYVNGAEQPSLIVNDLKLGDVHGPVALWTGSDTEAYFSDLSIR
jgi:hypothetical protein